MREPSPSELHILRQSEDPKACYLGEFSEDSEWLKARVRDLMDRSRTIRIIGQLPKRV